MSIPLIWAVTIAYVLTALALTWQDHRPGMGVAYAGYALANIGLIWDLTHPVQ